MAKIYKRANSPYYHYRFQYEGKTYRGTTGSNNKNQANIFLDQKLAEIKGTGSYLNLFDRLNEQIQKLSSEKQIEVKRKLAFELLKNTTSMLTIAEAFIIYQKKKKNSSTEQLTRWKGFYTRLSDWLNENHYDIKYINQITRQIADKYMADLWNQNYTPNTYNKHLSFFKSMFDAVKSDAGLADNVWNEIEQRKLETHHKKPLTIEQFKSILPFAEEEIKTLLLLGFYTGLRLGDCCNLKRENIDFQNRTIRLISSKTSSPISIKIHDSLYEALLDTWDITQEYVLPNLNITYKKNSILITNHIKELFTKSGIQTSELRKRGRRKSVSYGFHSLRHTTVSMLHSKGVAQTVTEAVVGHNTKIVHNVYKDTSDKQVAEAINKLPYLDNEI